MAQSHIPSEGCGTGLEVLWSSKRDYLLDHASTSPHHKYTAQTPPDALMESTQSGLMFGDLLV